MVLEASGAVPFRNFMCLSEVLFLSCAFYYTSGNELIIFAFQKLKTTLTYFPKQRELSSFVIVL